MKPPQRSPQPALTPDETLAADHLMAELQHELTGDTVVGLETRRPGPAADQPVREVAPRRASA